MQTKDFPNLSKIQSFIYVHLGPTPLLVQICLRIAFQVPPLQKFVLEKPDLLSTISFSRIKRPPARRPSMNGSGPWALMT
jgi:hypothetical protein